MQHVVVLGVSVSSDSARLARQGQLLDRAAMYDGDSSMPCGRPACFTGSPRRHWMPMVRHCGWMSAGRS